MYVCVLGRSCQYMYSLVLWTVVKFWMLTFIYSCVCVCVCVCVFYFVFFFFVCISNMIFLYISSWSSWRAAGTDFLLPCSATHLITFGRVPSYILCQYRAVVDMFLLVHVKGSTGVHRLWVCPYFSEQCPACLARLVWIVFGMGGWWPYSSCFVGYCLQNLFNRARSILE